MLVIQYQQYVWRYRAINCKIKIKLRRKWLEDAQTYRKIQAASTLLIFLVFGLVAFARGLDFCMQKSVYQK